MNLLFLTLLDFDSINEHNIYTDLLREFCKHGHQVYVISPIERKSGKQPRIIRGSFGRTPEKREALLNKLVKV